MYLLEGGGTRWGLAEGEVFSSGREWEAASRGSHVCRGRKYESQVHSGTTETRNVGGAGSWQEMNLETGVGSSRGKAGACSEARLTGFLLAAVEEGGSKESRMLWDFGLSHCMEPGKTGALICITQIPLQGQTPGRAGQ